MAKPMALALLFRQPLLAPLHPAMRDISPQQLEPTLDASDSRPPDTAPAASIELFNDFEQQRMLARAHEALFGEVIEMRIGRYRIERQLGAGGMGEVYLGHDDELARKVAIKRVLHHRGGPREQARLRREAQALARLTHEHVVSVHEIDEHEGQLFVVMQYVEGETLADYLGGEPRPWPEVLARFLAAGRGLAAAHDEGLIHRDFKPDNVLLGTNGEVRVADFGLVLAAEQAELSADAANPGALDDRLSTTGALMGTVRYMSPEQALGETVDARSDQFSFCVALYEGLWGQHPFPLDSVVAHFEALERGEPTPPPRSLAPAGLWRAIRRGLARDPDQRWPDMDSLLRALEAAPRWRRAWIWTTAGVLGLGLGLGLVWAQPRPDPCAGLERELAGTWDQDQREALAVRFAAGTSPHLVASRTRVFGRLERWAESWVDAREQLCEAGEAQRLSPTVEQLRMACLTRQQRRVATLVELLGGADEAELARAVEAVDELPTPSSCAEELALLGVEAPPPAIVDAVEHQRTALARAEQLRRLGRVEDALSLARATLDEAAALAYAPLIAEAKAELARAEIVAGSLERGLELLGEAIDLAEASRHDALAEALWTELALRLLGSLRDTDEGADALRRAEVASERADSHAPRLAAKRAFARARLARAEGRSTDAEAALREAIDIAAELPQDRSHYLSTLALWTADEAPEQALALHRQALADAEAHYGPDHPQVAVLAFDLGSALRSLDRDDEARAPLERAIEIWTQTHAAPHRDLARAEQLLAELALAADQLDQAQRHAAHVAEIRAQILPANHPEHGETELLLAVLASLAGDDQAARDHTASAIEIWSPRVPADDPNLIRARVDFAQYALAALELDEAAAQFELVIAHGSPDVADEAALGLVELELLRDDPEAAAAALEQLDARLAREQRSLGWTAYTHALLWAVTDLRRGQLSPARVDALAALESPFAPAQLHAWLDDLGLGPRDRARLGLR